MKRTVKNGSVDRSRIVLLKRTILTRTRVTKEVNASMKMMKSILLSMTDSLRETVK